MDSIERLDAYVIDKPTYMEIDGEGTDYMDEDLMVQMLREEGAHWGSPAIVEATTELKNWAWEGAAHPMEEPITPAKNIVSIPIESVSASIIVSIESVCDHIPIEFISVEKSFPYKRRNPTC